ncbi:Aquaporin-9 [Phytophthora nicotianae]|uniref:Aquaporin-9 n=1 Tax=Phytophthora nicotianae TaxID=4792 RepID=A0A0W8DM64_PHYNI|nr:Aquaporin-9 [Phytophthora nicotianae]
MASLGLGDDEALYTLAYFTSDWVRPMDAIALPRLCAVLDGVNALNKQHQLIGLLEVRRTDEETGNTDSSCGKTQRLEPSQDCDRVYVQNELRQLCENDNNDAAEFPSSTDSDSSWKALGELLKDDGAPGAAFRALQALWKSQVTVAAADIPEPLDVNDPNLVKMREEALELFETGQFLPAASSFVSVLLRCPTCTKSSFNLAVILQMIGETYFAVASILRVVALDDSDSVAHTVLRYEQIVAGLLSVYYQEEPDLVVAGYRSILASNRDSHVRAVHSLATLEGATTTKTAAPAYVAKVFDELADSFEEKLVAHLEYRVPWQLVEALQKLSPPGFIPKDSTAEPEWVVADVGCGTGLCGRLLRSHVDISPLMIEKTRAEGSYDELQNGQCNAAFLLEHHGQTILKWRWLGLAAAVEDSSNPLLHEAFALYSQAAALNDSEAVRKTGTCFHEPWIGVCPSNHTRALERYQLAAELGDAQAGYNCGLMLLTGDGVPRDLAAARNYYADCSEAAFPANVPCGVALVGLDILQRVETIARQIWR